MKNIIKNTFIVIKITLLNVVFYGCINNGKPEIITIDTWVMSCRVFNRGLEYAFFERFTNEVKKYNVKKIVGEYVPTKKNTYVKAVLIFKPTIY